MVYYLNCIYNFVSCVGCIKTSQSTFTPTSIRSEILLNNCFSAQIYTTLAVVRSTAYINPIPAEC